MRLEQVGLRYGHRGTSVLSDITLTFPPGQVSAVLGRNGSGKSTLLRIVAGVLAPTSGRVDGRPRVVGYVPERFPSRLRMPARAYLRHMGRIRGMSTAAAGARSTHLLERLEFVGGQDTPIAELSKGNAQKVALAQAFLVPPGLLVLDEPWSGLDPAVHGILIGLVGAARDDGAVVVLTEHRPAVVEQVATDIYHLVNGTLVAQDLVGAPVAVGQAAPGALVGPGGLTGKAGPPGPTGPGGLTAQAGQSAPVAAAERTLVVVDLRLPAGRDVAATAWPGVVERQRDGDVLRLVVESTQSDLLLGEVLRQGCSVLRLVPRA